MADSYNDPIRPLGEIAIGPSKFEQFLDRNIKGLIAVGVLTAVGALGWIIYNGIQDSHENAAAAELSKSADLTALQAVVSTYPKTVAAGSAEVLLAHQQWKAGQKDTAIQTLRSFIAAQPKHPARPSAQANLAGYLQAQGQLEEAKATYLELTKDRDAKFIEPFALIQLGDIAKAAGDLKAAEEFFTQARAAAEETNNQLASSAAQRLQYLKAKAPVEIDAPPAPPAPPEAESDVPPANLIPTPAAPLLPGQP